MLFFKCEAASKFEQLTRSDCSVIVLSVVKFPGSTCSSRRGLGLCAPPHGAAGGSEPLSVSVQDASLLDVVGQQEPGDQVVALVLRVSASPPVSLCTGGSWLAGSVLGCGLVRCGFRASLQP